MKLTILVLLVSVGFVAANVNPKWILPKNATAEQIKARDEAMLATLSEPAKTAYAELKAMGKKEWNYPMYESMRDKFLASLPKSVRDEILNFGQ